MTPFKIVQFLINQSPYSAGEVAGFPEMKATALVAYGAAKYRPDLQKEYDKEFARKQKAEEQKAEEAESDDETTEPVRRPRRTNRVAETTPQE